MGVLSNLEPKSVFHYFEEISRIPHGSGNVEQISDYLVDFAKARGLLSIQDELKNVIIVKEATPGYENEPAVILQGHMDMVAVKKQDCDIDMKTEGLRLAVDGDSLYALGTSLGGDDGIAVAYALALLDSDAVSHPRLEVILTVDEEVGMDGAREIDLSMLTGNRMVNLDSEDEGIFLTSCAGGVRVKSCLEGHVEERDGLVCEITIGGLLGGHSGGEIHKERGNSNCLLGRILYRISQGIDFHLIGCRGGLADNAIPRETKAHVVLEKDDFDQFNGVLRELEADIRAELLTRDPDVFIRVSVQGEQSVKCLTREDTKRFLTFLCAVPNGVLGMSADMQGLVETSLNLGILECRDGSLQAEFSVRSSVESAKEALVDRLNALTAMADGSIETSGDYPGWKYRKDSPLREKMVRVYRSMYGKDPRIEAIHAGLECGILGSKINDLDCVSIGPDMRDIHTTEETLSIASVKRVWEFLLRLLETKENETKEKLHGQMEG